MVHGTVYKCEEQYFNVGTSFKKLFDKLKQN